ncbi:MAG: AAA family ATPase [Planctomycetota bacterium]|nr:AAA family ATPase [Planctomycetota bacterium]
MILLITGPANVGKSTVAKTLAKRRRAIHIEVDTLRHFIVDDEYRRAKDFQYALNHSNVLSLLRNYEECAMDVIVTDISSDPETHSARMEDYRRIAPTVSVMLNCRKELLENDRNKYGPGFMSDRVEMLHQAFQGHNEAYDLVLDTSDMTAEQVVNTIDQFWTGGVNRDA